MSNSLRSDNPFSLITQKPIHQVLLQIPSSTLDRGFFMILQELTACIPSHCYFFSAFRQGCRTGPQVADLLAIPHTKEDGMMEGKQIENLKPT